MFERTEHWKSVGNKTGVGEGLASEIWRLVFETLRCSFWLSATSLSITKQGADVPLALWKYPIRACEHSSTQRGRRECRTMIRGPWGGGFVLFPLL